MANNAPALGKIPVQIRYLKSIDLITGAIGDGIDLSSYISQVNIIEEAFKAPIVVLNLIGDKLQSIIDPHSRAAFEVTVLDYQLQRTRVMSTENIARYYSAEAGQFGYVFRLKSFESVYSPTFARPIPGSLQEILSTMIDECYMSSSGVSLSTIKPKVSMLSDRVPAANLVQQQTLDEYVQESREYAIAPDFSPYMMFNNLAGIIGVSLRDVLKVEAIPLVVSSYEKSGNNMSRKTEGMWFIGDYQDKLYASVSKAAKIRRTAYYSPLQDGSIMKYSPIDSGKSVPQNIEQTEVIWQGYELADGTLDGGKAMVLSRQFRSMMESGLVTFQMYTPHMTLHPGDVVTITTAAEETTPRFLIWKVEATASNITGSQNVFAIALDTIESYLSTTYSDNNKFINDAYSITIL